MTKLNLVMNPGISVVLEGLDRTGKTTQRDMLRGVMAPDSVVFAHMPSGFVPFTNRVYAALESESDKPRSGLAQQLAHLSCHAESIDRLLDAMTSSALLLDRWWWSTLAYGWYGGSVQQSGLAETSFKDLIEAIWSKVKPSVVFVFMEPHQLDIKNALGVEAGYRALLAQYEDLAVVVPKDTELATHRFIVNTLLERNLAHFA